MKQTKGNIVKHIFLKRKKKIESKFLKKKRSNKKILKMIFFFFLQNLSLYPDEKNKK